MVWRGGRVGNGHGANWTTSVEAGKGDSRGSVAWRHVCGTSRSASSVRHHVHVTNLSLVATRPNDATGCPACPRLAPRSRAGDMRGRQHGMRSKKRTMRVRLNKGPCTRTVALVGKRVETTCTSVAGPASAHLPKAWQASARRYPVIVHPGQSTRSGPTKQGSLG